MTHWIGTSWKMNKTLAEARTFAEGLKSATVDPRIQPFVIPPFTAVREVKAIVAATRVKVGAQNMHWADDGAWTGEVSPVMLKDCNLDIVELGHSERREHFGETDDTVGLKTEAAVRHGLIPLICIGETLSERQADRAQEVLETQVREHKSQLKRRIESVSRIHEATETLDERIGELVAASDAVADQINDLARVNQQIMGALSAVAAPKLLAKTA